MLLKILISYIIGYVNISVEGYFIERFMNICISKKILLWNIKREKSTFLYANVGIKNFKKLKEIAKKTKCKINIKEKKGLPFVLNRHRKRKIFLILLIVFFIILFTLSNFIWNIEVTGTSNISKEEILETLKENGLKIGMAKNKIDTQKIINSIRLNRDDVAWVGIGITGTNATVKIVEADLKPEIIDENDYCNIVSKKEGLIVKVTAKNGTPLVKKDDIVKKGSILIAGYIEGKYTGTRYVHSEGEVLAKVWYSKKDKIELQKQEYKQTGKNESKYSIRIKNFVINLYKTLPNFENYDTIIEEKKLKIFSNFYLPIEIIKNTYYETELQEKEYTKEEAKEILIQQLEEQLKEEIKEPEKITNKQINVYENDDSTEIELIYEVLETIGIDEKIVF